MESFTTAGDAHIYQIPLSEFPGLIGNSYMVISGEYRVLIDTGSGFGQSNDDLVTGLDEISKLRAEDCSLKSLTHILITHGHIDHFGGLSFIREQTGARICIHELDRRIVSNHIERLSLAAHRLEEFLKEAGVSEENRTKHLEMYKITKSLYRSVEVDSTYQSMDMSLGPFRFTHVPGHCAGHVIIHLHDVIFSGDHILEKTSPHQAPEQITLSTGLDTYLRSLEVVRPFCPCISCAFGGHENPIYHLEERINDIRSVHQNRLNLVLSFLAEPHTIVDISRYLFGKVEGYTILLALEETGAHVEYLYQRGYLEIKNLSEVEDNSGSIPIVYKCVECAIDNI
jgi:glyoxylase-like metal-dependent hydrolase (beta-lactamase superfamily II)